MTQKLITIAEFCKIYRVSRSTFYRLVSGGDITIIKIGGATRIKVEDANSWFESLSADNDNESTGI
ncbi:MAG: helix-turn-helix domain-containing protein [Parasphingorhabdus sp.]